MNFALLLFCVVIVRPHDIEGVEAIAGEMAVQMEQHQGSTGMHDATSGRWAPEAVPPSSVTAAEAPSSASQSSGVVVREGAPAPAALPSSSEEHAAALAFLLEHLPPVDAQLPRSFLERNVVLALQAWHAQPWARAVPWDVFLNEVRVHVGGRGRSCGGAKAGGFPVSLRR